MQTEPQSPSRKSFTFTRLIDGLTYNFTQTSQPSRHSSSSGAPRYRRNDGHVLVLKDPQKGWAAVEAATGQVTGKSWEWTLASLMHAPDYPPEGEWVSKKGHKLYVYVLKYSLNIGTVDMSTLSAGHVEAALILLDAGAAGSKINWGWLLPDLVRGEMIEAAQLLLDYNADIHAYDQEALHAAREYDLIDMARLLLDPGADANP
ncbi:hypothetical protein M427DRAFT_30546 [Gonapodya prolifera JEL478]|uniref:Uncharacterized protein n=1 Tax=Gonapodya prolifera (strain JEL478) TaxID=1344416 RepID=A0A139AKU6_GONPJ|nr:hypothetical protein M427DRAFT_30546 [Gonapodya prolifera JEL478]|eukprot:KXS17422.1 hypothetical protein M427DRAFT_30546 [Gonapodya prolifera JEL478]